MPKYFTTTTAAVAVVGADLWTGEVWARAPYDRILRSIAVAGSAVILDFEAALSIDEVRVGNFTNTALLAPQADRDTMDLGDLGVPAGAQLRLVVTDAAATSVINTQVELVNV